MLSLATPIADIPRYGKLFAKRLAQLKITTVRDLLLHFPFRYEDLSRVVPIARVRVGERMTVRGTIIAIQNRRSPRRRLFLTEGLLRDTSGTLRVIWFNQPFLTRVIPPHTDVWLSGVIADDGYGLHCSNPIYEKVEGESLHTARIIPIYPTTQRLTQKTLRVLVRLALPLASTLTDNLPKEVLRQHRLCAFPRAVTTLHFPEDMERLADARRRMAFAELFFLHCRIIAARASRAKETVPVIRFFEKETKDFVRSLPFTLTDDQRKAAWEILKDMGSQQPTVTSQLSRVTPMHRLLDGDVGSGKTVVAAIAALNTILSGYRVLFMAPTELLAEQHAQTLTTLFENTTVRVALLTASHKLTKKERMAAHLLIGTQALLHAKDASENIGLVIIDEQHRFGVAQRSALLRNANDAKSCESGEGEIASADTGIVEKELSYTLNGLFFEIQREIGRFARERQYADMLETKLKEHAIAYKRENAIVVGDRKSNFADFIIENRILVELKAKPFLTKEDYMQTMRYLQAMNARLGLLVNFRQEYLKPKRVLNSKFASFASDSHHSHRYTPHVLSMTATPIPRTLAQTIFGDFDISLLHMMPKGRKQIMTRTVTNDLRSRAYDFIRKEMQKGRQVFVVCPLIDPSDMLGARAATDVYDHLRRDIFPDCAIGLLHGRMKQKEREETMRAFVANELSLIVATSVIEVGIDVPNATVMMIEGAERFGLAQLHQLRGRVGRSDAQSYCFLFTDSEDPTALKRLTAVVRSNDGFALAEADLRFRGPGEMFGTAQSGYIDLRFARWNDLALIKETKEAVLRFAEHIPIDMSASAVLS